MICELYPQYSSRKSFYGKAQVKEDFFEDKKIYELYSYGTLVASIVFGKEKTIYEDYGRFSQTTTSHQNEFFKQNGLTDKEIKALYKNGKIIKEV